MDKEEVYDEKISFLMLEIIEICEEYQIPMLMSFSIPTEEDPDLECTTAMLHEEWDPPSRMVEARDVIFDRSRSGASPMMVNMTDDDGNVIESVAVLG